MNPLQRASKILNDAEQFNSVPSKTVKKHLKPLLSKHNMLERDNKRLRNKIKRLESDSDE